MKNYFYIICLFFLANVESILCVDIGSDTVVTRFNTQQTVNNGDRIAGFAAIQGGFAFASAAVSGTFDSFFEASGVFELNLGNLILTRDLVLRNSSTILSLGNIFGNGHVLDLAPSITCVPSNGAIIDCSVTELTSVMPAAATVLSAGWSFDSNFVAAGLAVTPANNELFVYSFDGSSLIFQDSVNFPQNVLDLDWHPENHLLAIGIFNAGVADELYTYSFDPIGGTLTFIDSADISSDVRAVAWHPSGNFLAVGTPIVANEIIIYAVNTDGTLGSSITYNISPSRAVSRTALDWDSTGNFLAVGTASSPLNAEVLVLEFDSGVPSIALNAEYEAGAMVNSVDWSPTNSSLLAIGLNSSSPRLRILNHDGVAGTLTQIASAAESLSPLLTLEWTPDGNCLALGKGVSGSDTEFKIYKFNATDDTLMSIQTFEIGFNVNTVSWSPNEKWLANGDSNSDLIIYRRNAEFLDDCFTFTDLTIFLNCNVCLENSCILFNGSSTINGRGNCLTIKPTATLFVDSNSGLLFKDIIIKGINDHRINFIDNTSTVSYQNVQLVLDDDYTMMQGKFDVIKDLQVVGDGYSFIYQSSGISRILECGNLILDRGVTFSYDPSISSQDLLQFTAATSKLTLHGATLHASNVGLTLTKGIMEIDSKSFISAAGTTAGTAISFGDGVSSANNFMLHWLPASVLEAMPGYIRLQNV